MGRASHLGLGKDARSGEPSSDLEHHYHANLIWIASSLFADMAPSQIWRTLLRNHADAIAAIDLCVVPTLTFECLFAFLVLSHGWQQVSFGSQ